MTRSRDYYLGPNNERIDVTTMGDARLSSCEPVQNDDVSLIEISTTQQSPDIKVYRNDVNGKYYASWYLPGISGFTELKEVPVEWVNNVLDGNVSFLDPAQSGNDLSGESYNLGEFEAVQRKLAWEGQKTTYWRKEAESRQRDIERLNFLLKHKKKDFVFLLICTLLMLISSVLIATLK